MEYRLEELFELQMGKTPSRNISDYWNSKEHKWISISDLSKCGKYICETKEHLSDKAIAESGISIIPANTVIMSFKLSIGKTAITKEPMYSNEAIMAFKEKQVVELLPDYVYYMFGSRDWNTGTNKAVLGKTLNKATLSKIKVKIHNIDEQHKIVRVLDKVASIITARQEELQMLDNLVKARFVEMFGNPVINEMSWEQIPLSDCIESIDNGKSFVCDSVARQGDWPAVLKLSAATYGIYRPEENKAIFNNEQFIEDATVRAGDLLFTRKNTPELVGMCAYVYNTPRNLMMPDLIFRLNTNARCNKIFLWKLINHDFFRDCIQSIATGSAKSMSNISKERLLGLKVILPPIELQKQFATFVEQTDKSKVVHLITVEFNSKIQGNIVDTLKCNRQ